MRETLRETLIRKLQLLTVDDIGRYAILNNICASAPSTIQTQPDAGSDDPCELVQESHLTADC